MARPPLTFTPLECSHGHPWAPGRITVGWMPCECPSAFGNDRGHKWVSCRTEGCTSIFYEPPHQPD